MIVRALSPTGDWTFGRGRNNYFSANKAIEQNLSTRLNSYLGDCFFALNAGLDWFNLLGSKNQLAIELAVRACILKTLGVVRIVNLQITLDPITRGLLMQYTVETIYSAVNNGVEPIVSSTAFLVTEDGAYITDENGDRLVLG